MTDTTSTTWPLATPARRTGRASRTYRALAASAAGVAGVIHALVAPEHFELAWYVGGFFVAVAAGQLALAVALARGAALRTPAVLLAIAANLAIVATYVTSRTTGLPFLPVEEHAGGEHLPVAGGVGNGIPVLPGADIEPVGALDFTCLLAELVLVGVLVAVLPRMVRGTVTSVMLGLGVVAFVARGTGLLA
ncbi:hypothetical protein [Terrabacter sp. C0L_2]|uniref:hypothetical protein n=1 Tax=Terrabacter sp. C0L_2 TaxID=3108389 RepID=UPI0017DC712C|nr:hypothetical protein [Dermatophilaceae bacterium]WVM95440.1 hypothetical protein U5C87_15730 [Terrabacter sp. C0L_2]